MKKANSKIEKAVMRKALGYDTVDTVDEYVVGEDGALQLSKRKTTTKHIGADMAAVKLLIELQGNSGDALENLSDEQLQLEKERLLALLAATSKSNSTKKGAK